MLSALANAWDEAGHDVTLYTFECGGPKQFELSASVRYRPLPLAGVSASPVAALMANLKRLRILRSAIRESNPEVVVSFTSSANVLTLLAAMGLGVPVIVSDRSDPFRLKIGAAWNELRALTYPRAAAVVCQTENVAAMLRQSTRQKVIVIPNPVPLRGHSLPPAAKGKRIFAMGRLDPVKGFDLLLRAFHSIAGKHREWRLTILGEGPERGNLEILVAALGLRDQVSLPGWVADPFSLLAEAEVFVLSSRVEGFPNALCEAMACGVPVIAFNCQSGPADILRPNIDGVLVPAQDVDALASAMERLIDNPAERARLRLRAPQVVQRFGVKNILQQWTTLFSHVTAATGQRKSTVATVTE